MSHTLSQHLGERFGGVTVDSRVDTSEAGLTVPANPGKLSARYDGLPSDPDDGQRTKVGLTNEGYVCYEIFGPAMDEPEYVFYKLKVTPDGAEIGPPTRVRKERPRLTGEEAIDVGQQWSRREQDRATKTLTHRL